MASQSYDIFRRNQAGEAVWVETAPDLATAKGRIIELAAAVPGQYVVFNQISGRLVSSGTVVASPAARATGDEESCSASMESETRWK